MAFMVPEYVVGDWIEVETIDGTTIIPSDYFSFDDCADLKKDGDWVNITYRCEKVGVRLSAPGYMDSTDWDLFDTREGAEKHVREFHEVDPVSGEELAETEA